MRSIRAHLTYANVMSTLFVFLVLAGGTAIAAKQLAKNSVGPKQLKKNSVTTAKLKKGAVTKAKLAANAVDSSKIADGSVTAAKIADGSVGGADIAGSGSPYAHLVARVTNPGPLPSASGDTFAIGTYTQPTDEDNQYLASIDVNFSAGCSPPRTAVAKLMVNPANPAVPTPFELVGQGTVMDQSVGSGTRQLTFGPTAEGFGAMSRIAPLAPAPRTFVVQVLATACGGGSGISLSNAVVDVIGIR